MLLPPNPRVVRSLIGPAVRGLVLQVAKKGVNTLIPSRHAACFNWDYGRDQPELARLYEAAKRSQWNASDLDWARTVDPQDRDHELVTDDILPLRDIPTYNTLPEKEQRSQRHAFVSWMLSQFLHGEQGALFAACQVVEAVHWTDAKLYGSTQVVDEGRHVEVFHRYLTQKLEKSYPVNDNLYVILDALMGDGRWDMKFLGMQIMIEGLALGSFGTMRHSTREPLLRDLLKYVITDEARHVHYGVVSLATYYRELSERERREREDWAYEVSVLMRNRFLGHEFYDEYYAHRMKRRTWDRYILASGLMTAFRRNMFKRLIPNLKRIGLLPARLRKHYAALGVLDWEHEKAAPELSADDLLAA